MNRKRLTFIYRIMMLFLHLQFCLLAWSAPSLAPGSAVAFAQQGGGRALISDPEGLLRGNVKARDAVGLINWVLMVSCAVPATMFTIHAGKRFNDQEYGAAFGSAIGAVIAGIGGYLAFSFI